MLTQSVISVISDVNNTDYCYYKIDIIFLVEHDTKVELEIMNINVGAS